MSRAIFVWPDPEAKLPADHALIVVDGFGHDQEFIFGAKDAALVAGNERVPLKALQRSRGDFNLAQVVFETTKPLNPGTRYALDVGGRRDERWTWLAGEADRDAPKWIAAPGAGPGEVRELGCGPSVEVPVKVPVENADAHIFLVVLDDGDAQETSRQYMIRARQGTIEIGHGMCSGPFMLKADQKYTAQIFALDGAGNRTSSPARVNFKGPK